MLTLLQLIWQRNQLGYNMRYQNILVDRGDQNNNVSNFLQHITYKFINTLTSGTQVALLIAMPLFTTAIFTAIENKIC